MKVIFENVIKRGGYDLSALLAKIDNYHIEGKLTDAERDELYLMAQEKPVAQYDVKTEIEKLWAAIREIKAQSGSTPEEDTEVNEFIKPTGAHDAYHVGDRVLYNGKTYTCVYDNCVWTPDEYPAGWEEYTE